MKLSELFSIVLLLPKARKHLVMVNKKLVTISYVQLINESSCVSIEPRSIEVVVKSYFWATRLVKNCHCLARSIALYQYLKEAGYEVEHKFGVNMLNQKLAAHAWVEYKHKPLNESSDLTKRFKVLK